MCSGLFLTLMSTVSIISGLVVTVSLDFVCLRGLDHLLVACYCVFGVDACIILYIH